MVVRYSSVPAARSAIDGYWPKCVKRRLQSKACGFKPLGMIGGCNDSQQELGPVAVRFCIEVAITTLPTGRC